MTTNQQIELGDIIRWHKMDSPIEGQDCVIAHVAPSFVFLLPLANPKTVYVVFDVEEARYIQIINKGRGILEVEHVGALKKAMEKWIYAPLLNAMYTGLQAGKGEANTGIHC